MTTEEVAEKIGISSGMVRLWADRKVLPAQIDGDIITFSKSDITYWLERNGCMIGWYMWSIV